MSKKLKSTKYIVETVNNFKTKYPTGFTTEEIDRLLLEHFPGIKLDNFKASLFINKEQIIYKNDVIEKLHKIIYGK